MSEGVVIGEEVAAPITPESTAETAHNKVEDFCKNIFPEGVPSLLKERLTRLKEPGSISFSRAELQTALAEYEFRSEERNKRSGGGYIYQKDKIFLPEKAGEGIVIHEMLHFISAHPTPGKLQAGILDVVGVTDEEIAFNVASPGKYDIANQKPNEAITEILAKAIEAGINLNSPSAFYDVYGYIKGLKDRGELIIGGSYEDYIFNTLEFFRKHLNTAGLLKDLGANYLLADPQGYGETINRRANPLTRMSVKLKGRSVFDLYRSEANKEGKEAGEFFQTIVDRSAEKFLDDERFDTNQKEAIAFFRNALAKTNQYRIIYLHPEHATVNPLQGGKFIYTDTGSISHEGGTEFLSLPVIEINLGLNDEISPLVLQDTSGETREIGGEFKFDCQLQAYFLWQGLKLQHMAKEGIIYDHDRKISVNSRGEEINDLLDRDVYQNDVIKDYLNRLTASELGLVLIMFKKTIGSQSDEKALAEILQTRMVSGLDQPADFLVIDSDLESSNEEGRKMAHHYGLNRLPWIQQEGNLSCFPRINEDSVSRFNN